MEYIVAVQRYGQFVKAAEVCGVTQSTLSTLIMKLEQELDVIIFNRATHPVTSTPMGRRIIAQAEVVLYNRSQIEEMIKSEKEQAKGDVRIGIIPTVAPYIVPDLFMKAPEKYPELKVHLTEARTAALLEQLDRAEIDIAMLTTPLERPGLLEIPLYYEKFKAYVSPSEQLFALKEIKSDEMPTEKMWVLQEGHCLRNQVFNFCKRQAGFRPLYEAGSIDTLIRIVDRDGGYTIIPELHVPLLSEEQRKNVRPLVSPEPVREISLVVRQDFIREGILNALADVIKEIIPKGMLDTHLKKFAIRL
jgi:Transcriptional regulator